jgi:hypothetical protein
MHRASSCCAESARNIDSHAFTPNVYLCVWFVYPILVPFYMLGKTLVPGQQKFESGVPQMADYYFMALMPFVVRTYAGGLSKPIVGVVHALIAFACYVAVVNLAWTTVLEDVSVATNTLYYLYDSALFITCLILYARFKDEFLRATIYGVGASVVLQALLSPLAPQHWASRQALFFNDENQLGYFCVLAASIFVAGARRLAIPNRVQVLVYGCIVYMAVISQCRAALLGLAALLIVCLVGRPLRLLVALVGMVGIYAMLMSAPSALPTAVGRVGVRGEYDTFATRGYDRLINYPEHLLFGAGEGAYGRFRSELYGSELHSSYGTVLFCYGLVGAGLCIFIMRAIWLGDPRTALCLVPAIVYGSAHQGLRFAFFWVMLAFVCCVALGRTTSARRDEGIEPTGLIYDDVRTEVGTTVAVPAM